MTEDDDFFGADEQEKRDTRAKRFGLEVDMLSDQQILDLHESLGITDEEKTNVRFEALHVYGTREMSTQDVFAYFGKYTPNSVEWINDESCNIVWLDKNTAARALNCLSKVIAGMPVRGACDPFQNDFEPKPTVKKNNGTSILLLDDTSKRDNSVVNVSDLNIPIPPGYWRLGESCPKAKYILLRYAKRTDKKPFRAEKFSEYYKKHGNPNYGGIRGIISESKKARMKQAETAKGNPWGRLAKDWNQDVLERPMEEIPVPSFKPKASKSLLNRLGTTKKRSFSPVESEEEDEDKEPAKKSKVPRMRMYADEEEARVIKMKELKKIRAMEKIEESIVEKHVTDLRNRIKNQKTNEPRKPLITSRLQMRPIKQEIKVTARNDFRKDPSESESSDNNNDDDDDDDELNVQQRSKVTVIVKKQSKPSVASTIWSRLADEKNKKVASKNKKINESDSKKSSSNNSSNSSSSSSGSSSSDTNKSGSESEPDVGKNDFSKTLNPRPGFRKDLKSRLGLSNSDHKSPLRIEINNDHYNKTC